MRASPPTHMAGDHSASSLYRVLADRCLNLEASHAKLEEELRELVEEKKKEKKITNDTSEAIVMPDSDKATSDSGWGCVPGFFTAGSPYKKVLDSMGHAVHVCTAASGEIVYWNHSAENLYGWKDYEVLGLSVAELLVDEEYYAPLNKIVGRLGFGQSWSGQFPFKKRSGENFMAMVTKSPLYEDGKLAGIITVSSDAATFNSPNSENRRTYQDRARVPRINLKKIQQHPRQLIAPVPQIASSVSNLASRLIPRKHDNDTCDGPENSSDKEHAATKAKGVKSALPGALAAKVLSKLHIGGIGSTGKEDVSGPQNSLSDTTFSYKSTNEINNSRASEPSGSHHCTSNTDCEGGIPHKINMLYADSKVNSSRNIEASEESCQASIIEYNQCLGSAKPGDPLPRLSCKEDENELEPEPPNLETADTEVKAQRQKDGTSSTVGSPPSRGDRESSSVVDCEIHWEDLQLGEEIGQGSYAVVHRGIWNGSDVAVKVYFGNQYREETLQDYKKEIDIMKRLRHPNVLLFMGAVYSPERLAIVTEFLPSLSGWPLKSSETNRQMKSSWSCRLHGQKIGIARRHRSQGSIHYSRLLAK
ncbi:uncharacterized protein LOC110628157 isoform X2 [Manihot esculenta]|uniref:uncharacterized protein LOC110628157 isoform X2 n=1 Tax=Manihot esculenta TaxID=3983 RepID=UPI001CC694FA|nr:uncharacterized protein LOC110628157 isoform X2 [Manihot esculenta]